jgi:hypothetical protein
VLRRTVVLVVAALAVAGGARADQGTGGWVLHVSGTMFNGTFTNPTASVVNGVAIGTQQAAGNPIVQFTFQNQSCGLYAQVGNSYCYTNVDVGPGKTASFSGAAAKPIDAGGLQMCSSADRGMDNTCVDVKSSSGGTTSKLTEEQAVGRMISYLASVVNYENKAIASIKSGHLATATRDLRLSLGGTYGANRPSLTSLLPGSVRSDITDDLNSIYRGDQDAMDTLKKAPHAPGNVIRDIESTLETKHRVLHLLHVLPH